MHWKNGGEGLSIKHFSLKCRGPNMLKCAQSLFNDYFEYSNHNFTLHFMRQNKKNCTFSIFV